MGQRWLRVALVMITLLLLEAARSSNGCWEQERIALLQLKSFCSGLQDARNWTKKEGSDCCEWKWVECNIITRRVTQLNLRGVFEYSNLINASLFLPFEELRILGLSYNGIVGCVENEGFEKLSKLRHLHILDLSYNVLNDSIPSSLGSLSSLRALSLERNKLKGMVNLQDLYNLTNLKELDLGDNQIESIQSSHGNRRQLSLINLEEIDLNDNLFNNSVLGELGRFSNLKSLNIRGNQLNGSINVKDFCALSNLETLDLSYNELNQFVTSKELQVLSKVESLIMDNTLLDINFLEKIGTLTSLKILFLYKCSLTGSLPAQGWCYLKSLEELSLRGNALRGVIAPCLGNLTSLYYLDISDNQFTGNVASTPLTNLTMLRFLSLSKNQFLVPASFKLFSNHSNLQFLSSDENKLVVEPATSQTWSPKFQLKGFILSNCKIEEQGKLQLPNFLYYQYDLRYVDLSYCNFGGIRFPHWLLENNTRLEVLKMIDSSIVGPLFLPLHPNSKLGVIDISNNKIQHEIPRNFCSLFPNLRQMYMSQNGFTGHIPFCLGSLRSLRNLDISHNNFSGRIPMELAMSSSLDVLRLSNNTLGGKIFPAVYYLINSLRSLYLDRNNFGGDFPDFSPIGIADLAELDVSDNQFSGKLPRWLWNMTNLRILKLSKNRFEGSIPMELCNLVSLEFLDLSQNHLSGTIPSCSNLQNIMFVHLSKNKLIGPLPHYRNSSLATLDLRENNLSGKIPDWIGALPSLSVLLLKANQFDGEIPVQLCRLYLLSILDLSQNKFSGPIPICSSNLTFKPRSESSYSDAFSAWIYLFDNIMENMGVTTYAPIEEYNFFGHGLAQQKFEEEILVSTKNATYTYKGEILNLLSVIDLSCNQLTGTIPPGLGNFSEIHGLNLSHNNLTGSIPSTFSKLKQIESLDLSYNNLNGRIPAQLTELTTLEVFTVAHNNLSGPLPDRKAQFGTFEESSYEGNPLLCGLPLKNSCSEGDSPETPSASSSEEEDDFIDTGDFWISFAVSYAIILLATVIVLYINPYWRRAWFYLVEDITTTCYYFIVDSIRRLPCFRRNI